MKKSLLIIIALVGFSLTSCKGTQKITSIKTQIETLQSSVWHLTNSNIHFKIDPAINSISGFSGCNNFSGKTTLIEKTVRFTSLISTKRSCPSLKEEQTFIQLMEIVNRYEVSTTKLKLYQNNLLLLSFNHK